MPASWISCDGNGKWRRRAGALAQAPWVDGIMPNTWAGRARHASVPTPRAKATTSFAGRHTCARDGRSLRFAWFSGCLQCRPCALLTNIWRRAVSRRPSIQPLRRHARTATSEKVSPRLRHRWPALAVVAGLRRSPLIRSGHAAAASSSFRNVIDRSLVSHSVDI